MPIKKNDVTIKTLTDNKQLPKKKVPFRKLIEFETRKSLHVSVTTDAYNALKILCYQYNISIQEFINHICTMLLLENQQVLDIIEKYAYDKRNKKLQTISKQDEESIYNAISELNPLTHNDDE